MMDFAVITAISCWSVSLTGSWWVVLVAGSELASIRVFRILRVFGLLGLVSVSGVMVKEFVMVLLVVLAYSHSMMKEFSLSWGVWLNCCSLMGVSVIVILSVLVLLSGIVLSGVDICSPTLYTWSGSSNSIPDCPGVFGTCAERTKCSICWEGELEETVIFALVCWPKFAGNWPSFPPPGQ